MLAGGAEAIILSSVQTFVNRSVWILLPGRGVKGLSE